MSDLPRYVRALTTLFTFLADARTHVKEIHIMHDFKSDFYGYDMQAVVLGYIRPELDYTSRG